MWLLNTMNMFLLIKYILSNIRYISLASLKLSSVNSSFETHNYNTQWGTIPYTYELAICSELKEIQ